MYRIVLIPLLLVLLLILAVALIPLLADKEAILDLAISALHKETGATLTVAGDTELTLFPTLGISLSDVAVTLDGQDHRDLRARSVKMGVQLLPLLKGNIEIDTVTLEGLIVRSDPHTEGVDSGTRRSDIAADGVAALAVPLSLKVKRLLIIDARWEEIDSTGTVSTLLVLVKLQAMNLNLEQSPIAIELQLTRPGEQPMALSLDGNLRINQQTQRINLDKIVMKISGATAIPVQVQTSGTIDVSSEVADLQLTFESGETRGTGSLHYANAESPRIDAVLQLNFLDKALLALVGSKAATAAGEASASAGWDEALPLAALRLIDTQAVLDIKSARFGDHTVNNLHVNLRAINGLIEVSDLTGNLYGGELIGTVTMDGRGDTASLKTRGSLTRLDIAAALAATESARMLSGNATVNWQLGSRGRSTNELIAALNGPIKLTTENVVLQGISVEKSLCKAVALTNNESLTANFPANTRFETLFASIQVANGKATLNPLRAELPGIALIGSGNYDGHRLAGQLCRQCGHGAGQMVPRGHSENRARPNH
jgi:AsmA protein